jgi:hypothetical protein
MVALLLQTYVVEQPWFVFQGIADLGAWEGGLPWRPLLAGAGLTALSAWLALRKFERMEF